MKKNLPDVLVALVVVGCSAILLAALTFALSGWRPGAGTPRTFEVDFPDVAGIKVHSELRYAGAPAGRVVAIRPLSNAERAALPPERRNLAVRVTVALDGHTGEIPSDVEASVGSDTLLSEKYVALTAGSPEASPLGPGAVLAGKPAFSIDQFAGSLGPLLANADRTVSELRSKMDELVPRVTAVLETTKTTADTAKTLLVRADKLIEDNADDIGKRITDLGAVMDRMNGVLGRGDETLNAAKGLVDNLNTDVNRRMDELGVVLQNLKVVTTHAKSITEEVGEKPSRLIWGFGKPKVLVPEDRILDSDKPVPAESR